MVPDRIERELVLRHPVERVWQALTTAGGLAGWFGSAAEGTRLQLVETGFAQVSEELARAAYKDNSEGWDAELADLVAYLDATA